MAIDAVLRPAKGLAIALFLALAALGAGNASAQSSNAAGPSLLTLDEAMALASEHAPGVESARRNVERGALSLQSAEIAFKPSASASASAAASDGATGVRASVSGSGTFSPGATWSVNLSQGSQNGPLGMQGFNQPLSATLSVNVRLWPPGGDAENWRTVESRRYDLSVAEQRLIQARQRARIDVTEAYGRLAMARERLALALEAYETALRALERQRELRAQGATSESDLIRAEITVLEQEAAVSNQRQSVDSLTAALADLVGLPVETVAGFELEAEISLDGAWTPPDRELAAAQAIEASLSVAAAARALETAKESLEILRRAGGPTVSVGGTVSAAQGDAVDWSVRVDGSINLFDSGAQANRLASAQREVAEAELAYAGAIDAVREEVEAAYRNLSGTERSLAIAEATAALRVRELEIGREQAARGLISEESLRRLERDARSATLDLENAKLNHLLALMNLKALLGLEP